MKTAQAKAAKAAKAAKPVRNRAASLSAHQLEAWFEACLQASRFKDYCPNGMQVEGNRPIARIACGVSASLAFLESAGDWGADACLVHHGWFWRGEDPRITGVKGARMRVLIESGMHLFAYHLPLDLHPSLGNNAQLAERLGWRTDGRCGDDDLISWHDLPEPADASRVSSLLKRRLDRAALAVGALERPIRRIAWCTGAAQDMLEQAARSGADAFVSGEISERTTHLARELGVVYFAAGHHATERFGVQALGSHAASELGLEHTFIDDPNPV